MMRDRRAVSLVELLIIMSASTVVWTLCSVVVCRTMRIQSHSRACSNVERVSLRLADQFRRDVRQALTIKLGDDRAGDAPFLLIGLVDARAASYSRHGSTILRQLIENENAISREEYSLPAEGELSIQQESSPDRLILTIAVPRQQATGDDKNNPHHVGPPISLQAAALIGSDRRFTSEREPREVLP